MKKILNIVIPMYNAELYIEKTICSILNSNLPRDLYNILVINDGSIDSSPSIVEKMMCCNTAIRMFSKENGGLSMARNSGIEQSEAEYIWFFDADDLACDNLTPIYTILTNNPTADVYAFEYNWLNEKYDIVGVGCHHPSVVHGEFIKGRDAIMQGYKPGSVCGMLLRKDFLLEGHLFFQKGITHEDVVFSYRMMAKASKVLFLTDKIYNYVLRENTMSRSLDFNRKVKYITDDVEVVKAFYKLADSYKNDDFLLSKRIRKYSDSVLFGCVYSLYANRKTWKTEGINKEVINKLKQEKLFPLSMPLRPWKRFIFSLFLNIYKWYY